MSEVILIDNDVVLKSVAWRLQNELLRATTLGSRAPAVLGAARFVIAGRLRRSSKIRDRGGAIAAFEYLLSQLSLLEPSETEIMLAADLEQAASSQDLELDGGESQLLAVLLNRGCAFLLTGDKRAIVAMETVAADIICNRVACMEQLLSYITSKIDPISVRQRICAEPQIDRAVSACFSCASGVAPSLEDIHSGLVSYTRHLLEAAPRTLLPEPSSAYFA